MRTAKLPYHGINQVMRGIKYQIKDGLPWARENLPYFDDPEEMFYWFKEHTTYMNDPKKVELLQSIDSMMDDNFWGVPGAGDCDCFTIALITAMIAQGWKDPRIYLVGREKSAPVHIYAGIKWNGRERILDLTNKRYNLERKYPYRQMIT